MSDLVVTWPKQRRFASYICALHDAERLGMQINFRIASASEATRQRVFQAGALPPRLYRVHDGQVRGWTPISAVTLRGEGEVARVEADALAGFWPPGWYIVCEPIFHDCAPVKMAGFRGWRWFDRAAAGE